MHHFYYFLEVGPNGPEGEPTLIGKMKADGRLTGIEEGKDFILERVVSLPLNRDALRPRTKTVSFKYRIQEVLHGARLNGGYDCEVIRVLLSHPKELTDLNSAGE